MRKKQLIKEKELITEDFIENALMVAGFIPVIGNIADIALICKYLWEGKKLYAGLMLFSLVPVVGDWIAIPFIRLLKASRITNLTLKNSNNLYNFLVKNPKAREMYLRLENHINKPVVGKVINQIERVPKVGPQAAKGLRESITQHAGILGRLLNKPINIAKSIGKEISTSKPSMLKSLVGRGPVAMGIKKHFQGQRLARFIEKNGQRAPNWLERWWVVAGARYDRRAYMKHFIIANNLLEKFGLPNFESFIDLFQRDENFRNELANDEAFTEMVGNMTTEGELGMINQQAQKSESGSGMNMFTAAMGMNLLKKLAQSLP